MILAIGFLIVLVAAVAVVRGNEVRLVLLTAAILMASAVGSRDALSRWDPGDIIVAWSSIFRVFLSTFSNEKFVVPICTAMGFAYVLRHTECDQHLVRLLVRPFRRVRLLLVPATVAIGFVVNIPLVSQTSTAVAVGTVLVPLLRAAGISSPTSASALALGASIGGELLNPAAPELLSVARILERDLPAASSRDCVVQVNRLVWWYLGIVTAIFWFQTWPRERSNDAILDSTDERNALQSVRLDKAMIPFLPLVLLFLTSPAFGVVHVPKDWLTGPKDAETFDSRLIGAAMLIGSIAAAVTMPKAMGRSVAAFFEGAGYGFTNIIGLIVAASCFGEGIRLLGGHSLIGQLVRHVPSALVPLAIFLPMGFAVLSGSGMAATQSLFEFYRSAIQMTGADPFRIGALVSLGAAAGRTMSPVAAVVLMCTRMTGTEPFQVTRRLAWPLLAGLIALTLFG